VEIRMSRFNGLSETVETVRDSTPVVATSLKRGVNEKSRAG